MVNPYPKLAYGGLQRVSPSCWLFRSTVNSGILVFDDGVAVVDTQVNAPMARRLLAAVRTITDKPIRYAINTHYHWDHWSGNDVFKAAGAQILSSELTREFMQKRNVRQRAFLRSRGFQLQEKEPALPDHAIGGDTTLSFGSLPVQFLFLGRAETDDAMAVYLPNEDVVLAGDTVMTGSFPILGQPVMNEGMAEDRSWIGALRKIQALQPKAVLPGHGPLATVEDLDFFADLQAYFLDAVRPLVEQGKSAEETLRLVEASLPDTYSKLPQVWGTPGYAILRAYRSMTGWQQTKPFALSEPDPAELARSVTEAGDRPEAILRAAAALERAGKGSLAIRVADEAARRFPNDAAAWTGRGEIYLRASRQVSSVLERADLLLDVRSSAEKALTLDPHYGPALLLLGSLFALGCYRSGDDPARAIDLLQKALAANLPPSEEARVHFNLGLCQRALEDEPAAQACFARAIELDPNCMPARLAAGGRPPLGAGRPPMAGAQRP